MNYETPQTPPKTLAERSAEWRANGGEARLVVAQAEWVEVYKEAEETESARVERMRHLYKERTGMDSQAESQWRRFLRQDYVPPKYITDRQKAADAALKIAMPPEGNWGGDQITEG